MEAAKGHFFCKLTRCWHSLFRPERCTIVWLEWTSPTCPMELRDSSTRSQRWMSKNRERKEGTQGTPFKKDPWFSFFISGSLLKGVPSLFKSLYYSFHFQLGISLISGRFRNDYACLPKTALNRAQHDHDFHLLPHAFRKSQHKVWGDSGINLSFRKNPGTKWLVRALLQGSFPRRPNLEEVWAILRPK